MGKVVCNKSLITLRTINCCKNLVTMPLHFADPCPVTKSKLSQVYIFTLLQPKCKDFRVCSGNQVPWPGSATLAICCACYEKRYKKGISQKQSEARESLKSVRPFVNGSCFRQPPGYSCSNIVLNFANMTLYQPKTVHGHPL